MMATLFAPSNSAVFKSSFTPSSPKPVFNTGTFRVEAKALQQWPDGLSHPAAGGTTEEDPSNTILSPGNTWTIFSHTLYQDMMRNHQMQVEDPGEQPPVLFWPSHLRTSQKRKFLFRMRNIFRSQLSSLTLKILGFFPALRHSNLMTQRKVEK